MGTKKMKAIATSTKKAKKANKSTWKKPQGMPKRPLSAYNLFFRQERARLLSSLGATPLAIQDKEPGKHHRVPHRKIGFANLAKVVADKWKHLEPSKKAVYKAQAAVEKASYTDKVGIWYKKEFGLSIAQPALGAAAPPSIPATKALPIAAGETTKTTIQTAAFHDYLSDPLVIWFQREFSSPDMAPTHHVAALPSISAARETSEELALPETTPFTARHEDEESMSLDINMTSAAPPTLSVESSPGHPHDDIISEINDEAENHSNVFFKSTSSGEKMTTPMINWSPFMIHPDPIATNMNGATVGNNRHHRFYENQESFENLSTTLDEETLAFLSAL